MQRLHAYPDIRAMFRRLLIATVTGVLAALAVAVFRHSMYLLEWLFLSNESGSLVNAAAALSPWRRALTPALGGLAAGVLLWGWQRMTAQRPHAPTDYMEALETGDGQFDYGASLVKSLASLLVVASGSCGDILHPFRMTGKAEDNLRVVLSRLYESNTSWMPIVDEDGRYNGEISQDYIAEYLSSGRTRRALNIHSES